VRIRLPIALLACAALLAGCSAPPDSIDVSGRVVDETVAVSAPPLAVPSTAPGANGQAQVAQRSQVPTVAAFLGLGRAARVAELNVGVGARVSAGQQVARLDDRALSAAIEAARAARRAARAQLDVLGVKLEDVDEARSTIRGNRSDVRSAIAKLEKTQDELVGKLEAAKVQRARVVATLKKLPPAGTKPPSGTPTPPPGAVPSRAKLEAALKKLDAGIAKLETALAKVDAGLATARTGLGQLESASAQTSDAEETLTTVQRVAKAALDGRDAAITLAEVQRDLATLTSPVDGVVVGTVQAGESVMGGAPVVLVRPSSRSAVDVWVTPETAARLRLGGKASVRIDSRPGTSYPATVTAIGPRALFPPTWLSTTEVHLTRARPVRVTLTDRTAALPPGTPADVRLTLGTQRSQTERGQEGTTDEP
jgi:multidrug efflux pump subunit AcrA (membrane-fusion protein)